MQKHVNPVDIVKSAQTNTSIYLLAKFGCDTAENEPEYEYGPSLIFVSLIFGPGRLGGVAARAEAPPGAIVDLGCFSSFPRAGEVLFAQKCTTRR